MARFRTRAGAIVELDEGYANVINRENPGCFTPVEADAALTRERCCGEGEGYDLDDDDEDSTTGVVRD